MHDFLLPEINEFRAENNRFPYLNKVLHLHESKFYLNEENL